MFGVCVLRIIHLSDARGYHDWFVYDRREGLNQMTLAPVTRRSDLSGKGDTVLQTAIPPGLACLLGQVACMKLPDTSKNVVGPHPTQETTGVHRN